MRGGVPVRGGDQGQGQRRLPEQDQEEGGRGWGFRFALERGDKVFILKEGPRLLKEMKGKAQSSPPDEDDDWDTGKGRPWSLSLSPNRCNRGVSRQEGEEGQGQGRRRQEGEEGAHDDGQDVRVPARGRDRPDHSRAWAQSSNFEPTDQMSVVPQGGPGRGGLP